jgi:hypothetical protein
VGENTTRHLLSLRTYVIPIAMRRGYHRDVVKAISFEALIMTSVDAGIADIRLHRNKRSAGPSPDIPAKSFAPANRIGANIYRSVEMATHLAELPNTPS